MEHIKVFNKFLKSLNKSVTNLGNNKYQIDKHTIQFDIRNKEKFKDPDAHGLPTKDLESHLQSKTPVILFVVEKGTQIAYYNSIKKLMENGSFTTPKQDITLFYLSSFKKFQESELTVF